MPDKQTESHTWRIEEPLRISRLGLLLNSDGSFHCLCSNDTKFKSINAGAFKALENSELAGANRLQDD